MDYSLNYKNEIVLLPPYNFSIADRIEKQDSMNISGNVSMKDRCQSMYNIISEIIGKEKTTEMIGTFKTADPNDISILYSEIVKSYRKPLKEYTSETAMNQMEDAQIEKLVQMMEFIEKAQKIKL